MSARRTHRRWALPTPLTIVTALAGLLAISESQAQELITQAAALV